MYAFMYHTVNILHYNKKILFILPVWSPPKYLLYIILKLYNVSSVPNVK